MQTMPDLLTIQNGARVTNTFTPQEYTRRRAALMDMLDKERINAALFTSIHNINYFTDFLYCAFGRPYGLAAHDGKLTTISANIDGGQPARRTVGDNLVYTDWRRDNYFRAAQRLLPQSGTIGIEEDHISVDNMKKLRAALPNCEFRDISREIMQFRVIKSAEEIAHIKQGAQICDIGGAAVTAACAAGVPEHEIALAATRAMVRETAHRFPHGELMDTWTWLQSGLNTDGAHNPVTTRRLEHGDILSLNCFSMIAGYYTALERTLFLGECPPAALRLWKINVEVHEAGKKLLRPGACCGDIARELNKIYEQHGLLSHRTFGYGHSFGILCHYYGREAVVELREDIATELRPGMVVSMEPMIMIPEGTPGAGGYREHDILVITETGTENITTFPYGPNHNIIPA